MATSKDNYTFKPSVEGPVGYTPYTPPPVTPIFQGFGSNVVDSNKKNNTNLGQSNAPKTTPKPNPNPNPALYGGTPTGNTPIATFYNSTPDEGGPVYTPFTQKDEDKIRRDTLARYQGQINATKNAYSTLLGETKLQGTGRLGESTAMQARGGLMGSDFGAAMTDKTRAYNLGQEKGVLESQATAISNIMAQAESDARSDIAAKRAAKQYGYESLKEFNASEKERKATNLKKLASSMITQNIDPTALGGQLKELAKKYKVSENDIINAYLNTKDEEDKLATSENKAFDLSQGQTRFAYDPATGEYKQVASVDPKEPTSEFTPYQSFSATQSIAKDAQKRTENAREMSRQANLIESSYNNIVNGGDRSLNTQAIVTSFNKILDPTSVVRESEYDRTAAGQSLLAQLEGKYQQIATGGAGITDETIKEAAEIARQYLVESQASIATENERARQMAEQFGLNPDFVTAGGYQAPTITPQESAAVDQMRADGLTDEVIQEILGKPISFNSAGNASASNRPQRNNNPLNIKASGATKTYSGVSGVDPSPATDGGQFLVFDSPEAGFQAAKRLIQTDGYKNLTVDGAMKRWSNSGYGGEITPSIKNKKISELTSQELDSLIRKMAEREGYFA